MAFMGSISEATLNTTKHTRECHANKYGERYAIAAKKLFENDMFYTKGKRHVSTINQARTRIKDNTIIGILT